MAHAPLTPEQRSMRSRIAAHRMHAQGKTSTAAGRAAFLERFEREGGEEAGVLEHQHLRA